MAGESRITWVPVGDVGEVRMGKQLSPASREYGEQLPYLRVANVLEGRIDYSDIKTMSFSEREREIYALRPGDILLNEGQESLAMVGRSATFNGPPDRYYFQNTLIRFRPDEGVNSKYASYVFQWWYWSGVFARTAEKTSISHLGSSRFAGLKFPLLPLSEQHRIVEAMDSIASVEAETDRLTGKLSFVASALLDDLLRGQSDVGCVADVVQQPIRNGYSPSECSEWTGVQMLGLGCLTERGFEPRQLKNAPPSIGLDHPAILKDGDVLVSRANTRDLVGLAGRFVDLGTPCIYPDLMIRLNPSSWIRPEFLELALRSTNARRQITAAAQGTSGSMVKISAESLLRVKIPLPSLEEQDRFLASMQSLGDRLKGEQAHLTKLRRIKQGLIDDLLSEQVSVADLG